jgi:hypothetical protein
VRIGIMNCERTGIGHKQLPLRPERRPFER